MHLAYIFFLSLAFLILVSNVYSLNENNDLVPVHKIVKRNRFKMKDKSVIYNNSMEDDEGTTARVELTTLSTTTATVVEGSAEEVSDTESEAKRLSEQMKKGVGHINMDEYINDEDADLGTNEGGSVKNQTVVSAPSTIKEKAS